MSPSEDLLKTANSAASAIGRLREPALQQQLFNLKQACAEVARAWCGSNIGYHSAVYWNDLKPKPPNVQFSLEWGLQDVWPSHQPAKDWQIHEDDAVIQKILRMAGCSDLAPVASTLGEVTKQFSALKEVALSILLSMPSADEYIKRKLDQMQTLEARQPSEFLQSILPKRIVSRDRTAVDQGVRSAPHQRIEAIVASAQSLDNALERMERTCREAASHMARLQPCNPKIQAIGKRIFVGHGQSPQWREVIDFIEKRLRLPVAEFNSRPTAGISTQTRLAELLDEAAFAFIIMTGEDQNADGKLNARLNVVHEAGLFQGRLGFSRAIILLEEGCEEFSNINGLGQIRFPKKKINAAFEDLRAVLEREGLIKI